MHGHLEGQRERVYSLCSDERGLFSKNISLPIADGATFFAYYKNSVKIKHHYYSILDINECGVSNGGCKDICVNTGGSYHCACEPGQILQPDQVSCRPPGKLVLSTHAFMVGSAWEVLSSLIFRDSSHVIVTWSGAMVSFLVQR